MKEEIVRNKKMSKNIVVHCIDTDAHESKSPQKAST